MDNFQLIVFVANRQNEKRKAQGRWVPVPNSTVLAETEEDRAIKALLVRSRESWIADDWAMYHLWYEKKAQMELQQECLKRKDAELPNPKRKGKIRAGLKRHLDSGEPWWTYEPSTKGRKSKKFEETKEYRAGVELLKMREDFGFPTDLVTVTQYRESHRAAGSERYLLNCMSKVRTHLKP